MFRNIGDYHFLADPESGITFRWGKTLDENPIFSPVPELADISISNRCSKGCSFCYKDSTPEGKQMSIDEMAECSMLFFTCPYGTPYVGCEMGKQFKDDCIQCTKHWLESEVQENEK